MAYLRCDCKVGDVPHEGAAVHKHKGLRCTRAATVRLQRTVDTEGKRIPRAKRLPFNYCAPCAEAIKRYQGAIVEWVL